MAWNPQQYLHFGNERLRPALDLMARIYLESPADIVDLGCGPGTVTALLRERWPAASITGIDNSAEMLAAAKKIPGVRWLAADMGTWQPASTVDMLFSNAALHWLKNHDQLFARLAGFVSPGGILAVQMPNNFRYPTHTIAADLVDERPWRDRLRPHLLVAPVKTPAEYYRILSPHVRAIDIWETEYLHVLEGDNPVADWTRGSLLVPLLGALGPRECDEFENIYRARIKLAYLEGKDGRTLLPFRRLFLVARR